MSIHHELQDIISGNGQVSHGAIIQSVAAYLNGKKEPISTPQKTKFLKEQEVKVLTPYIDQQELWYKEIDDSKYIGEGAEQKIFEYHEPDHILKLNSSIFYESWGDYFNSLLLHNYFFPHLAYELIGFCYYEKEFNAVVKQPFVHSTENTNLDHVKEFLLSNGFVNKKANDYFHPKLGIILEDLHDENVLTHGGVLQFIDTVFYLTDKFFTLD